MQEKLETVWKERGGCWILTLKGMWGRKGAAGFSQGEVEPKSGQPKDGKGLIQRSGL